jgi:hypothetical protein
MEVVHVAMSGAKKGMKINHEENDERSEKPSRSSLLRGRFSGEALMSHCDALKEWGRL